MRAPLALVLAALALSCSGADDAPPNIGPDPSRSAPPPGPLPEQANLLGEPCSSVSAPNPGELQVDCGKDQRISVVRISRRTPMPEGARPLEGAHGDVFWAVEDHHVWVQSTCIMCRTFVEITTICDPALMSDEQLSYAQASAQLPGEPRLRTDAAWQDALTAWKPPR